MVETNFSIQLSIDQAKQHFTISMNVIHCTCTVASLNLLIELTNFDFSSIKIRHEEPDIAENGNTY